MSRNFLPAFHDGIDSHFRLRLQTRGNERKNIHHLGLNRNPRLVFEEIPITNDKSCDNFPSRRHNERRNENSSWHFSPPLVSHKRPCRVYISRPTTKHQKQCWREAELSHSCVLPAIHLKFFMLKMLTFSPALHKKVITEKAPWKIACNGPMLSCIFYEIFPQFLSCASFYPVSASMLTFMIGKALKAASCAIVKALNVIVLKPSAAKYIGHKRAVNWTNFIDIKLTEYRTDQSPWPPFKH